MNKMIRAIVTALTLSTGFLYGAQQPAPAVAMPEFHVVFNNGPQLTPAEAKAAAEGPKTLVGNFKHALWHTGIAAWKASKTVLGWNKQALSWVMSKEQAFFAWAFSKAMFGEKSAQKCAQAVILLQNLALVCANPASLAPVLTWAIGTEMWMLGTHATMEMLERLVAFTLKYKFTAGLLEGALILVCLIMYFNLDARGYVYDVAKDISFKQLPEWLQNATRTAYHTIAPYIQTGLRNAYSKSKIAMEMSNVKLQSWIQNGVAKYFGLSEAAVPATGAAGQAAAAVTGSTAVSTATDAAEQVTATVTSAATSTSTPGYVSRAWNWITSKLPGSNSTPSINQHEIAIQAINDTAAYAATIDGAVVACSPITFNAYAQCPQVVTIAAPVAETSWYSFIWG